MMTKNSWTIVISIIALLFLLTAGFSLWLNNTVFNRENFVRITVDTIQQSNVRNALSAEVVDEALKDLPAVKSAIGEPLQSALSGLLGGRRLEPVLAGLAENLNLLITAKEPQGVTVDISTLKGFIKPIAGALDQRFGKDIKVDKLPNSLVLIKQGEVPSIYGWGVVLLWLGPILGLIGLGSLAALIWRAEAGERPRVLKTVGSILALGSLVFIILVKVAKSPLLASVESSNGKIVAGGLFDAFTAGLIGQTWVLAVIGLAVAALGYWLSGAWKNFAQERRLKEAA